MAGTLKVRAMTMDDIKKAAGLSSISGIILTDARYQNLFKLGAYYWFASVYDSYTLMYVRDYGGVSCSDSNEYGVRPVVSLKSKVRAKGTNIEGTWNIEI